jgi:hypothetical protein
MGADARPNHPIPGFSYPSPERGGSAAKRRGWGLYF